MRTGAIELTLQSGVAHVRLIHPGKFNAMSRAMWHELRSVFERIQGAHDVRCVLLQGADGNFCAGGDITEYPSFRFDPASLHDFHERDVWGGLQAMLDCDVPIVALIQGNCMGAGLEMACCCDIRMASTSARFGAPIAHLGFPMAPREAQLVARELGLTAAREMLLAAAVMDAASMLQRGFLHHVHEHHELAQRALTVTQRIAALAPQAARMNKQTFRAMYAPAGASTVASAVANFAENPASSAYHYAASIEHREGIDAFLSKRKPVFKGIEP
jgi:enoyl-CoA hydratase/carnithine racemase